MMFEQFVAKAAELLAKGQPFVTASVVRFEAPISGKPGDKAIIFQDGRMWGWIGGAAHNRWSSRKRCRRSRTDSRG